MNRIFNNDIERIYLSSEYLFLKENEADGIEFKDFDDFYGKFKLNQFLVCSDDNDTFVRILKENAEKIYNVFIQGKSKAN